jgi:hypothetical protein
MKHNGLTHTLCEHFAGGPPRFQRDRCSSFEPNLAPRSNKKTPSLLRHAAQKQLTITSAAQSPRERGQRTAQNKLNHKS